MFEVLFNDLDHLVAGTPGTVVAVLLPVPVTDELQDPAVGGLSGPGLGRVRRRTGTLLPLARSRGSRRSPQASVEKDDERENGEQTHTNQDHLSNWDQRLTRDKPGLYFLS